MNKCFIRFMQLLYRFFLLASLLVYYNVSLGEVSKDTINQVDAKNRKQAYWIEYSNGTKIAEGNYIDNKKSGIWKIYRTNGSVSTEITYKNDQAIGEMKSYFSNGTLREKGFWSIDHWIGEYFLYYENGKISSHFLFNQEGDREGVQNYFYPSGKLKMIGKWLSGVKEGELKEFYPDGSLKSKKYFSKGNENVEKRCTYAKGEFVEK